MVYQNYLSNPLVQQDPGRFWEVSARPLREIDELDIESILGPKPQSQPVAQGGAEPGAASPSPQVPAGAQPEVPPAAEAPVEGEPGTEGQVPYV